MTSGPGHLRPVGRGRRRVLRWLPSGTGRPRWRWVALALAAAVVTLLLLATRTGRCADVADAVDAVSSCTASPSEAARVLIGLAGATAVAVLLRRAFRMR